MSNETFLGCCRKILSNREEKIFYMYFGINCRSASLEGIADEFSVTRERVRQIFDKAIPKIRKANFEVFNCIFEKAKKGFLIEENAHNFDPELDDLTMAKICHKIYGKQCIIIRNKYLRHTWINNCNLEKVISSTLECLKESPVNINIGQILNYLSGDSESLDFCRRFFEDLVYFNEDDNTLSSLMPLNDRFRHLLEKYDGVISIQEIMDNFGIGRNKARQLMKEGPCFIIGKTLCYSYHINNILVQLVKTLNYAEKPLSIKEYYSHTVGTEFESDKQEFPDIINSLIDSHPQIFTRINNKIALTEWYIKRKYSPHKKYTTELLDAITEIVENLESPATSAEICDLIKQKYGEDVSSNLTSVRLSLKKLYEMKKIGRIKIGNEYKYFLPKSINEKLS